MAVNNLIAGGTVGCAQGGARRSAAVARRCRPSTMPARSAPVRPLRRRQGGASRGGDPRHLRILPRPRRDHPPAHRGHGFNIVASRPTGRRRPHRRLCPPSAPFRDSDARRSRASRPGCGATSRCAICAWLRAHNERRPPERRAELRGLDVYSLSDSITCGPRLSRQGRSGAREEAREPLWLPDALAGRPGALRPRGRQRRQGPCEEALLDQLRELLGRRLD